MIEKVSKTKERQEGITQAKYKYGNTQILLHFCKKDIVLKKHKHKQLQFGYTFYGKYHFLINEDIVFYMSDSHSYILNSYISHEAIALTDYYALDIKYHGEVEYRMHLNYQFPSKEVDMQSFSLDEYDNNITINKILGNENFHLKEGINLVLTKNKATITLDKNSSQIIPMEIYKIDSSIQVISQKCNNNEILIINLIKVSK